MESRRSILSAAISMFGATGISRAAHTAGTAAAEIQRQQNSKIGWPGDLIGVGLVPNDRAAASKNTAALKALVDPAGTFQGNICFRIPPGPTPIFSTTSFRSMTASTWTYRAACAFQQGK